MLHCRKSLEKEITETGVRLPLQNDSFGTLDGSSSNLSCNNLPLPATSNFTKSPESRDHFYLHFPGMSLERHQSALMYVLRFLAGLRPGIGPAKAGWHPSIRCENPTKKRCNIETEHSIRRRKTQKEAGQARVSGGRPDENGCGGDLNRATQVSFST